MPTPDERPAQAPVLLPLPRQLALVLGPARVHELALDLVQVQRVLGRPVERRREAGAAVEVRRVSAALRPFPGRLHQVRVETAALAILLEPVLEPRPLPEQRLVGDLDRAFADGEQPACRQDVEHVGHLLVLLGVELGQRNAAAHDGRPSPAPASRSSTLRAIACSSPSKPA